MFPGYPRVSYQVLLGFLGTSLQTSNGRRSCAGDGREAERDGPRLERWGGGGDKEEAREDQGGGGGGGGGEGEGGGGEEGEARVRWRGGRPKTGHVNRRTKITPYRASPLEARRSIAMRRTRRVAPDAPRLNQRDGQETEQAEGGEPEYRTRGAAPVYLHKLAIRAGVENAGSSQSDVYVDMGHQSSQQCTEYN